MIIQIFYKQRKYEIEINETYTVKKILDTFYDTIYHNNEPRYYTFKNMIFKFGDDILNQNEEQLDVTAEELDLDDNDNFTLINSNDINPGKIEAIK